MTFDRRYPHMIPLDGRAVTGLDQFETARAARIGRSIGARTQTKPFYNVYTGGIFFSRYDAPTMGVYELPMTMWRRFEGHDVDALVSHMNLSLVPNEVKEKWGKQSEETAERDARRKKRDEFESRAHDFEDYAAFRDRKRRGTQTVVKVL